MRKFLLSISLVGFWGCEDTKTSESEPNNILIGNWTLTSVFVTVYSNPTQTLNFAADGVTTYGTMIFNEDATYSWQGVVNSEPSTGLGTWSMEDDILTFVENGESSSWIYSISNSNNWSMSIEYPGDDVIQYATLSEYNWTRAEQKK